MTSQERGHPDDPARIDSLLSAYLALKESEPNVRFEDWLQQHPHDADRLREAYSDVLAADELLEQRIQRSVQARRLRSGRRCEARLRALGGRGLLGAAARKRPDRGENERGDPVDGHGGFES